MKETRTPHVLERGMSYICIAVAVAREKLVTHRRGGTLSVLKLSFCSAPSAISPPSLPTPLSESCAIGPSRLRCPDPSFLSSGKRGMSNLIVLGVIPRMLYFIFFLIAFFFSGRASVHLSVSVRCTSRGYADRSFTAFSSCAGLFAFLFFRRDQRSAVLRNFTPLIAFAFAWTEDHVIVSKG